MSIANPSIEDLDALIKAARNYKAAIKRKSTHAEKNVDWKSVSQTRLESHNYKTGELNHMADVAAYELHAACVDAGQAKPLGSSQYEPREFYAGPMHRYTWHPAKPKSISGASQ